MQPSWATPTSPPQQLSNQRSKSSCRQCLIFMQHLPCESDNSQRRLWIMLRSQWCMCQNTNVNSVSWVIKRKQNIKITVGSASIIFLPKRQVELAIVYRHNTVCNGKTVNGKWSQYLMFSFQTISQLASGGICEDRTQLLIQNSRHNSKLRNSSVAVGYIWSFSLLQLLAVANFLH